MKKIKKVSVLLLCLVFLLSTFTAFAEEPAVDTGAKVITIVHTNDTHGRVAAGGGMGFSFISAIVKDLKASNPNTLVLDAGDTFHGTTFATLVEGESVVRVMNALGYDVMTPGNHDFNYGQERLMALKEIADFDMISANIKKSDGSDLLSPYVIKEVDGVKIGIFGLSTPETSYKTHPQNVEGLTFANPIDSAQEMVDALQDEADIIVALAHLGDDESSEYTSVMVAEQVEGIDLIVDGHSHSTYENGLTVGDTVIASTGEYDENLGVVTITLNGEGNEINATLITGEAAAAYKEDEEIRALMTSITAEQQTILSEVVGNASVHLDGERADVRTHETNLGNLITDTMIATTGADAALTNGGGIRASIDEGDITKEEVITVLPFGNYIVTKQLSGADVKAALEHGTSGYPEPTGSFSHVAGISYAIDMNKPVGDRIVDIKIKGEPIDLEQAYIIATNDFLAAGGDNYTMFADKVTVNEYMGLDEALIDYIKANETVAPVTENRISVIEKAEVPEVVAEPEEEPAVQPEADTEVPAYQKYIVASGDVLWKIAEKFGTTWQKLAEINNMSNPNLILPGQEILVP